MSLHRLLLGVLLPCLALTSAWTQTKSEDPRIARVVE